MSHAIRPLPPIPTAQRSSLDAADPSSSGSSTPASSDDFQPPLPEHTLRCAVSLPIIPPTMTVKFAPLPEISPRKRKSNFPLGVAARSQMLQQRREHARIQNTYRQPPIWSEDLDDHLTVQVQEEVEEEDPLEVLGRLIADKSKSLWRRVASKGNPSGKHAASDDVNEETTMHEEEHAVFPEREELPVPPKRTLELLNNNGSGMVENSSRRDFS